MKGIKLLFIGWLVSLFMLPVSKANADDAAEIVRAATRRDAAVTVTRQQTDSSNTSGNTQTTSRSTSVPTNSTSTVRDRTNSVTTARTNVVTRDTVNRTSEVNSAQSTSARTATTVLPRTTTTGTQTVISSPSRTATTTRSAVNAVSRTSIPAVTSARTATTTQTTGARSATTTISRNATTNRGTTTSNVSTARSASKQSGARVSRAGTLSAEEIINRDYTTCREVYYNCMDEFCANKDSQLKRCACSSRVNEFDAIKNQLAEVEDKLLDFNQRLLTVNMDKEDAEAIFTPTEGELAFQEEDKSDSKKLLDEISNKLNATFDTSSFDANLAPISLSLNVDAAFDTVDSLAGSSTTSKSGTELYSAALPICREMALEVCTQDELDIVESGYQMAIEQDCNTVAKAYQTQQDLAREKIREGSALLDISRLDTYQERNSDDILTCKKKMLDLLTNTSVCGTDLQKCLDISGQYIDPSTGEAILTSNLVNLDSLITRPEGNQTWTTMPGNEKFVTYLNSKKMFLESATENCQDIADYVWEGFLEDALAQIKLAQESKMEEVRQSCTTLTTQCLSDTAESLEEFDARALSIFGVQADKTVKQMCSEVQNACTALLDAVDGGMEWNEGMTAIASDKTYETIMQTCREVGRACIIQSCKSISGNFGLCENIQTSVNRKAIINRTACWDEVLECVASAGIDSINKITELRTASIDKSNGSFYTEIYGSYDLKDITNDELEPGFNTANSCIIGENGNCIYDICAKECGFNSADSTYNATDSDNCRICRLAERVWGNCEAHPSSNLRASESHNMIKIPDATANETLLSWFAKNTNTEDALDSCRDTSCGPGFISQWDPTTQSSVCVSESNISDDAEICPPATFWRVNVGSHTNCCKTNDGTAGARDSFGNCCLIPTTSTLINGVNWNATKGYCNPSAESSNLPTLSDEFDGAAPEYKDGLCLPASATFVMAFPLSGDYYGSGLGYLFCTGTFEGTEPNNEYPSGKAVKCNGDYIVVAKRNTNSAEYISPRYTMSPDGHAFDSAVVEQTPINFYKEETSGDTCTETYNEDWSWLKVETAQQCSNQTPVNWLINYK